MSKKKSKKTYDVVIELDSAGYYVASVPAIPGCHTQAKSLDTLLKRVSEAIELCQEEHVSEEGKTEFVGIQRLAIS